MIFDPLLDLFRGKAITIPPYDGAFRPNNALETAAVLCAIAAPDNLCIDRDVILFSSGGDLLELQPASSECAKSSPYPAVITALAVSPTGRRAVALADGRLLINGQEADLPREIRCITALAFESDETLYLCNGSDAHPATDWVIDLMEKGRRGSVWRLAADGSQVTCLARHLGYPGGILIEDKRLVVSESWNHRLVAVPPAGGQPEILLDKLPGYPGRLSPSTTGGAWLALFAPRNRLVEFVLQEEAYRRDMMREIPRRQWIAPTLAPSDNFLDPLQCGAVKTMGIRKPWAPSRSYGLAAYLDAALRPVSSYHSRADGSRHGITTIAEIGGRVLATASGGDKLLDLGTIEELGVA